MFGFVKEHPLFMSYVGLISWSKVYTNSENYSKLLKNKEIYNILIRGGENKFKNKVKFIDAKVNIIRFFAKTNLPLVIGVYFLLSFENNLINQNKID
jgi:hypothetical protein